MKIKQYQIDAFATRPFEGNPAAVCPLESWLEDRTLQAIAEENNLSETAFFVPSGAHYELRWFTPVSEVDLCGHATLATAHVIFEILGHADSAVLFDTRSGMLSVQKSGEQLQMDFPARPPVSCDIPDSLLKGLGIAPTAVLAADDYVAVYDSEDIVRAIAPDQTALAQLDLRGVIITSPGNKTDFVSRFFAPKFGIPEDPVTGSAHCTLAPYWSHHLGKNPLTAHQVSKRGGYLTCEIHEDRVFLSGNAVTFMQAEINF